MDIAVPTDAEVKLIGEWYEKDPTARRHDFDQMTVVKAGALKTLKKIEEIERRVLGEIANQAKTGAAGGGRT